MQITPFFDSKSGKMSLRLEAMNGADDLYLSELMKRGFSMRRSSTWYYLDANAESAQQKADRELEEMLNGKT